MQAITSINIILNADIDFNFQFKSNDFEILGLWVFV